VVLMPGWPVLGRVALLALRSCEVIVPSRHLAEPLRRWGIEPVHVCENFAAAAPASLAARDQAADLVVLWNSNIMASKGFFLVAGAVGTLAQRGHKARLVALGRPIADGTMDLAEAERQLRQLSPKPWFAYRGTVDRSQGAALLQAADVVCLPSRYKSECQPLALIEAMCAGRALVIADTPALRATVGGYPCELVSDLSVESVAAALMRVLDRIKAQADGSAAEAAAAAVACKRFSPSRFDREIRAILKA
jgi:glycosyltransferase involved in cell wall biosynthesis